MIIRQEKCIFVFTENYVLQQIVPDRFSSISYFSKDNSKIEIDFLVQTYSRLIPIEVKAEENVKSKSLRQFITIDYAEKQLKGLRCSMKPYIDQGWMENIPLYSILFSFFLTFFPIFLPLPSHRCSIPFHWSPTGVRLVFG